MQRFHTRSKMLGSKYTLLVVILLVLTLPVFVFLGLQQTQNQSTAATISGNQLEQNISPQPTCIPRPACLDSTPRCMLAEPKGGWCPICLPRPSCLDTTPKCKLPEPVGGWCNSSDEAHFIDKTQDKQSSSSVLNILNTLKRMLGTTTPSN